MPRLSSLLRGRSLASAVGVLSILALGGCPVAQTPRVPEQQGQQQQTPPPQQPGGEETLPRPIPPPPGGETATSGPGSTTPINEPPPSGGGGGGGGGQTGGQVGGGGQTGGTANVQVDGPTADQFVDPTLPGAQPINISYQLQGLGAGLITKVELVAARDNDDDGEPDNGEILEGLVQALDTQGLSDGSNTASFNAQRTVDLNLLSNGFGRFLVGIRIFATDGSQKVAWAAGHVVVDTVAPTLVSFSPTQDLLLSRDANLPITVQTQDNSPHTIEILLDPDGTPDNGNEITIDRISTQGNSASITKNEDLSNVASGTYTTSVRVSDGVHGVTAQGGIISLTRRLIGTIDLNDLGDRGFIMRGFNFNDLAGSAMAAVPDLDGDGNGELIVVSRYGKPFLIQDNGIGFGEAYLVYGESGRISGIRELNSVGRGGLDGLVFAGIRTPVNVQQPGQPSSVRWTLGMASVTAIPDMDGDDLPELVFGFPRVESVSLAETSPLVQGQNNTTFPDLPGMGSLEFNAFVPPDTWNTNMAQFTRGGIVIVSSHNSLLRNRNRLNRKFDRVLDLHEVGQLFTNMRRPNLELYVIDVAPDVNDPFGCEDCIVCTNCNGPPGEPPCNPPTNPDGSPGEPEPPESFGDCLGISDNCFETFYERWIVAWDTVFDNQGPGGFLGPWSIPPIDPPLANPTPFPFSAAVLDLTLPPSLRCDDLDADGTPDGCEFANAFWVWGPPPLPFPCTTAVGLPAWNAQTDSDLDGFSDTVWTGFYGPETSILEPIGARVLGQAVDDEFGMSVSADDFFLYISAPNRTPTQSYVPQLPTAQRNEAGVVYQLRTNVGSPTLAQLWMEPGTRPDPNDPNTMIGLAWPFVDAEIPNRADTSMPVPHQYVIEDVGSARSNAGVVTPADDQSVPYPFPAPSSQLSFDCPPPFENARAAGLQAPFCTLVDNYTGGQAGYYVRGAAEIVGPHGRAHISNVRSLGDVNGDGVRDFAVGSADIRLDVGGGPSSPVVGGIFIVYGRPTGTEGDYLLEQLTLDPSDQHRLDGVFVHGTTDGETLARVFADAGDVNGDGFADVIIGNEGRDVDGNADAGEAIVLFGSTSLISPAGGWAPEEIPESRAIRFVGAHAGDQAGANVEAADVDGDGFTDLLIAAPGLDYDRNNDGTIDPNEVDVGGVYLIYGGPDLLDLSQPIRLADVGTRTLPGALLIGRQAGDQAGGGSKTVSGVNPDPTAPDVVITSQGIARLGDIDGDGREDFAISAMLADPNGKTDAGEVYVLYGRGD